MSIKNNSIGRKAYRFNRFNLRVGADFNLSHTLECGQFFRYRRLEDVSVAGEISYAVQSKNRFAIMCQKGSVLEVRGNMSESFVRRLFRLDDNFKTIKAALRADKNVARAMDQYPGLRLMRQDPWECIISYVCSSASNIPKIQKNIELLSRCFGKKKTYKDAVTGMTYTYYTFPTIGQLTCKKTINSCRVGYRDKFIHEINNILTKPMLKRIVSASYSDAKELLKELPGVGDKVADCVCLFSLDHLQSFPVDVWVKRTMTELYGKEIKQHSPSKSMNEKSIRLFAASHFGRYAGYSQQYLFHLRRKG